MKVASRASRALLLVALALGLGLYATPSKATLIDAGAFSGNDCSGFPGFAGCRATTEGTQQGGTEGSPVIYKRNSDATEDFGNFASIDGSEFSLTFNSDTHILSWTYTPSLNDPEIHYFTIKQADGFHLLYGLDNPILNYSANILTEFGYRGFSHVSWFDTGADPSVPEPATIGLLGSGLLGLAAAMRRRANRSRWRSC